MKLYEFTIKDSLNFSEDELMNLAKLHTDNESWMWYEECSNFTVSLIKVNKDQIPFIYHYEVNSNETI